MFHNFLLFFWITTWNNTTQKGKANDGEISLKSMVLPMLKEIADLLKIAFGPNGDAIMIQQKSPKEIKVTKVNNCSVIVPCGILQNNNNDWNCNFLLFHSIKCGLEIINTFKGSRHPLVDLVLDMLQTFAKHHGADGIKRIVLMLYYFLHTLVLNTTAGSLNYE